MWLVSVRGVSHDKFKGGLGGGGIGPGVVYVLGKWEPLAPIGLTVVDENVEVLFEPLVCLLGLPIYLRMVSEADILFDIKHMAQFSGKVGGEAGIVTDDRNRACTHSAKAKPEGSDEVRNCRCRSCEHDAETSHA